MYKREKLLTPKIRSLCVHTSNMPPMAESTETLRTQLAAALATIAEQKEKIASLDPLFGEFDARGPSRFQLVAPTACENMRPCLHTTGAQRLAHGCDGLVWSGTWSPGGLAKSALPN